MSNLTEELLPHERHLRRVVGPVRAKVPRSYTLNELRDLFGKWCDEHKREDDRESLRWTLSILWSWLARKEREGR